MFHLLIFEIQSVLEYRDKTGLTMTMSKKIFDQFLIFVNLYQHAKQFIAYVLSSNKVSYTLIWWHDCISSISWCTNPKSFSFLISMNSNHQVHFWDTVNFRAQWSDLPYPFLTMPDQTIDELLNFVNFYQHSKTEAVSSICYGEIFDLKIMESDCLIVFWPVSQEQDFFQI